MNLLIMRIRLSVMKTSAMWMTGAIHDDEWSDYRHKIQSTMRLTRRMIERIKYNRSARGR